jgi:hypothetical protein
VGDAVVNESERVMSVGHHHHKKKKHTYQVAPGDGGTPDGGVPMNAPGGDDGGGDDGGGDDSSGLESLGAFSADVNVAPGQSPSDEDYGNAELAKAGQAPPSRAGFWDVVAIAVGLYLLTRKRGRR